MKTEIEQMKIFKSEQMENFAMEYENLVAGMKALDKTIEDLESLKDFQDNGKNTEKYAQALTNLATLYGVTFTCFQKNKIDSSNLNKKIFFEMLGILKI